MKMKNWQFLGICFIFAAQLAAIPYMGSGMFLRPAERSIASKSPLFISSQEEANVTLKTAQGIIHQIHEDKKIILSDNNDHQKIRDSWNRFTKAEQLLSEYENALVQHLTQLPEINKNFEQEVLELSQQINELNVHEVKSFINKKLSI